MGLAEIGKKTMQIIGPHCVLTAMLVGLNTYFQRDILLSEIIIFNILLSFCYVIIWHELRLQSLEKAGWKERI